MFEEDGTLNVTYNLYRVLDIRPPCTDDGITRAYRKLALKYHPDKATGDPEKFQQIKTAHDILKDPIKRDYYDRFGDKGLRAISLNEIDMTGILDTSSFFGRFVLKSMTKPTRLIPIFLFIAMLGVFFVLFLNFSDKKLYHSEMKSVPWYAIFGFLWFDIAIVFIAFALFFYRSVVEINSHLNFNFESAKFKDIPAPKRRFLSRMIVTRDISTKIIVLIGALVFVYCTVNLALNLGVPSNILINGKTWRALFDPFIIILVIFAVTDFIFRILTIMKYRSPNRIFKERALVLLNDAYGKIANILFSFYLLNWLDSSVRSNTSLFKIFCLIYAKIVFDYVKIYIEMRWRLGDEIEILLKEVQPELYEQVEKKIESQRKFSLILIIVGATLFIFTLGLVNSHLAGYWPESWSMTLAPILIFVFCSIVIFGCCCPCLVTCMDISFPQNSFDKYFTNPTTGEEDHITIIEISRLSAFFHGYGFAPIQRRIRYND